jgi:hypothetical protein
MRDADGGPSEIATPRLVTDLAAERARIDRMISDLIRSRDVLDEVIHAASGRISRVRPRYPPGPVRRAAEQRVTYQGVSSAESRCSASSSGVNTGVVIVGGMPMPS